MAMVGIKYDDTVRSVGIICIESVMDAYHFLSKDIMCHT